MHYTAKFAKIPPPSSLALSQTQTLLKSFGATSAVERWESGRRGREARKAL